MQTTSPLPKKTTAVKETLMDFSDAIRQISVGKKITKLEWKNEKIYGILDESILKLHKEDDKLYQWIISERDLLGTDWIII